MGAWRAQKTIVWLNLAYRDLNGSIGEAELAKHSLSLLIGEIAPINQKRQFIWYCLLERHNTGDL